MDEKIPAEIYTSFQKIKEKDWLAAETLLKEGLAKASQAKNETQEALFYSTLGVLSKMRGEMKEAWRYYEQAEKILPEDPALKIISSKFLIEQFAQYDLAIKKLKKVIEIARHSPAFLHQSQALLAIAFLKKGEKKKAIEALKSAMADDFQNLPTAGGINLDVVEAFLSRNFEKELCENYLQKALQLAQARKEEKWTQALGRLLKGLSEERGETKGQL